MQAQIKSALMTTGVVLVTIYLLRKVPQVGTVVDQALRG